jgi:formylglycine-generating enzyme required for sulfatase activity
MMNTRWRDRVLGALVVTAVGGAYTLGRARADVPATQRIYFGATLEDNGMPMNGTVNVVVELFAAETGGASVCRTSAPSTPVTQGRLRIELDPGCVAAIRANTDLWSQLTVGTTQIGGRSRLGMVPYAVEAVHAVDAVRAASLSAAGFAAMSNPDCPTGYTRDTSEATITLCRRPLAGSLSDEVVKVGTGSSAFWVDRYESSVNAAADASGTWLFGGPGMGGELPPNGQWRLGGSTLPPATPRTPPAFALSVAGRLPASLITWFQAAEACRSSGKRLPTGEEWIAAAQGTNDPGMSTGDQGLCRTASGATMGAASGQARTTGVGSNCRSGWGAQDMIGNLWEWTGDWYASPGTTASGSSGLRVVWPSASPNDYRGDGTINIGFFADRNDGMGAGLPAAEQRGGYFNSTTNAGVFAMTLSDAPSSGGSGSGFRCVLPRP